MPNPPPSAGTKPTAAAGTGEEYRSASTPHPHRGEFFVNATMPASSRSGQRMPKERLRSAGLRDPHRRVLVRHENLDAAAFHRGDELIGVRLDDREGAVMGRDDGLRLEEAADRKRRGRRAHREAVPYRHDQD